MNGKTPHAQFPYNAMETHPPTYEYTPIDGETEIQLLVLGVAAHLSDPLSSNLVHRKMIHDVNCTKR